MCDEVELAQEYALQFNDSALRAHMATRQPARFGLPACIDCDDEILPARQRLGAERCIDCQADEDLRNRNGPPHRAIGF